MLTTKIKGSTLLEAVISLTILMVIFSIAIALIININKYTIGYSNHEAEKKINTLYIKTIHNKTFFNEVFKDTENIIEKEVIPYKGIKNIMQVRITVYDLNYTKIISEQRILKYE